VEKSSILRSLPFPSRNYVMLESRRLNVPGALLPFL